MKNETNDELFDVQKMQKTIKSAKRRANLKTIFITSIVIIAFIIVVISINRPLTRVLESPIYNSIIRFYDISNPNEFIGEHEKFPGIFRGENRYTTYKIIEGKVIYTGENHYGYGLFHDEILREGMISTKLISFSSSERDVNNQRYNALGQREMIFFYPFLEYDYYRHDLHLLEEIGEDKVMEVALSFDREYSFNEVKSMIPEDVTLSWLWINDKNENEYRGRVLGENDKVIGGFNLIRSEHTAYGVSLIAENGELTENPTQQFIHSLMMGRQYKALWQDEFNQLYAHLIGEDKKLTEDDLHYLGAVVTGNTETLSQLLDLPFIKASSIGVITDKY